MIFVDSCVPQVQVIVLGSGSGVEYKIYAVIKRGRIKGRFHALAVNIGQEEE